MPIHEKMKPFYPDNWSDIRALVLDRAKHRSSSVVSMLGNFEGKGE